MKRHELSAAFRSLPEEELLGLAEDIKQHGQRLPIITLAGEILDGWHRYLACKMIGVKPITEAFTGADPAAFVKSMNHHRRHETASQRSMAIVIVSAWREKGNKNQGDKKGSDHLSHLPPTAEQMAAEAGTSVASVKRAKAVVAGGTAELKQAVVDGKITVDKAAKIAKLPKKKQAAAAKKAAEKKPEPKHEEPDLAKELERADTEIRRLQRLVESLKASDTLKELAMAHEKFSQLEGRLQQSITTENEAKKQAAYSTKLLENIRKVLGVAKNSEIIPKLNKLVVL